MYLLSTLVAQHMDHDDHGMGDGGWWLWGMLMMIVVLAAIGLVVWLIVRSVQSGGGGTTRSPRDVLNDRFARGEIDTEEYEERISKLR
jgi:putative membrane protein